MLDLFQLLLEPFEICVTSQVERNSSKSSRLFAAYGVTFGKWALKTEGYLHSERIQTSFMHSDQQVSSLQNCTRSDLHSPKEFVAIAANACG